MPIIGTPSLIIAAVMVLASSVAHAGTACDFYADEEYGGEKITLYKGHALTTDDSIDIEDIVSSAADFQRLENPEWQEGVASVRVQPGCTGIVTDGSDTRSYTSDQADISEFGAEAVGFVCTCR